MTIIFKTALRSALMALLAALPLCAGAQVEVDTLAVDSMVVVTDEGHEPRPVLRFGYVSYETALKAMPDYATASKRLAELKAKYDDEARRVADEFNAKYEEFLDGQAGYPATILHKRQGELQELLERNVAFRQESRRLIESAEKAPPAAACGHTHRGATKRLRLRNQHRRQRLSLHRQLHG